MMPGKTNSNDKNKAKMERLSKLDRMIQIRQEALDVKDRLMSADIEIVRTAEKDLEQLLERFYDENMDMMAPQQYEAARKDFGYFLTLVEMAIGYYASDDDKMHIPTVH